MQPHWACIQSSSTLGSDENDMGGDWPCAGAGEMLMGWNAARTDAGDASGLPLVPTPLPLPPPPLLLPPASCRLDDPLELLPDDAAACFCDLAHRSPHALHSVLAPFGPERHLCKRSAER